MCLYVEMRRQGWHAQGHLSPSEGFEGRREGV